MDLEGLGLGGLADHRSAAAEATAWVEANERDEIGGYESFIERFCAVDPSDRCTEAKQRLRLLQSASEVPETECDRLAAHPEDRMAVAMGVPAKGIEAARAVVACFKAVTKYEGVPRLMFQYGRALDAAEDAEQAVIWYRRAAEQGHVAARASLGVMFVRGRGVLSDPHRGLRMIRDAADAGYLPAEFNLGAMHHHGVGVQIDLEVARFWYRRAAEKGDGHSQLELGKLYEEGKGGPASETEALAWYRRAKQAGIGEATQRIRSLEARRNQRRESRKSGASLPDADLAQRWIEPPGAAASELQVPRVAAAARSGPDVHPSRDPGFAQDRAVALDSTQFANAFRGHQLVTEARDLGLEIVN